MRKETAAHTPFLSATPSIPLMSGEMALEITPEPGEAERKAILEALAAEAEEGETPSPWRAVGLGPGPEEDEFQAGAPPRQSRGTTRA